MKNKKPSSAPARLTKTNLLMRKLMSLTNINIKNKPTNIKM